MKTSMIKPLVLAFSLAFSAGAMAEAMTKIDHKAAAEKIASQYKADKTACGSMSGNAKDVCVLEAKGKEKIAKAELEYRYKPTDKNRYEVEAVTAKANYATAKERCDDLSGNAKDVCVKEAKAVATATKSDGKADMKSSEAVDKANRKIGDAKADASTDKRNAEYAVAKEKCGAFAGVTKDACVDKANAQYGK